MNEIPENKEILRALRESEAKFRSIFDKSPVGSVIVGINSRFVQCNAAFCDFLGYTEAELIGKTIAEITFPEDIELGSSHMKRLVTGEIESCRFKKRYIRKTGAIVWGEIHISLIRDADGKPAYFLPVINDITDSRAAEEKILAIQKHYQAVIEKAPDGIVLLGNDGLIKFSSNTARKIFGYGITEELRGNPADYTHPDDIAGVMESLTRLMGDPTFVPTLQYRFRTKQGQWKWVESVFTNLLDDPYVEAIVINFREITERKIAEEKIQALLAEKDLLLREVHHRIKNNMNTLVGLLSMQASTMKDASAVGAIKNAERRVQSMQILYDKLYRTADYHQLPVSAYLPTLIDEIIAVFPTSAAIRREKNIQEFMLGLKQLQPLGIIINELLTNAMKYAFAGRETGKITVAATLEGNTVTITVADDGNGIPPSVDFNSSTGFGLMLVRGLSEQLDGKIRIERGGGTKVILEFERH